jgi:hypothetical protein
MKEQQARVATAPLAYWLMLWPTLEVIIKLPSLGCTPVVNSGASPMIKRSLLVSFYITNSSIWSALLAMGTEITPRVLESILLLTSLMLQDSKPTITCCTPCKTRCHLTTMQLLAQVGEVLYSRLDVRTTTLTAKTWSRTTAVVTSPPILVHIMTVFAVLPVLS